MTDRPCLVENLTRFPNFEDVRPSVFGTRQVFDGVSWHNGVITDDGLPVRAGQCGCRPDSAPCARQAARWHGTIGLGQQVTWEAK